MKPIAAHRKKSEKGHMLATFALALTALSIGLGLAVPVSHPQTNGEKPQQGADHLDVVLMIDTSESMAWGWDGKNIGSDRDPKRCNIEDPTGQDGIPGNCSPFQDVKKAALSFIDNLSFPDDRVGVVTFDKNAMTVLPLSSDYNQIYDAILHLRVFEGSQCPYSMETRAPLPYEQLALSDADGYGAINPCRVYSKSTQQYYFMDCPMFYGPNPDGSQCGSTNTADGLALAGSLLTGTRPDALPVLVLLSDGAANTAHDVDGRLLCPSSENSYQWFDNGHSLCRDADTLTRHCWDEGDTNCVNATYPSGSINIVDQANYDADDRARDMFDLLAANDMLVFTIGMGNNIQKANQPNLDVNGNPPGETLLKYGAFGTYTHMTDLKVRKGEYYYGNDASSLNNIFLEIAKQLVPNLPPALPATITSTPAAITSTPGKIVTPIQSITPIPKATPVLTTTLSPTVSTIIFIGCAGVIIILLGLLVIAMRQKKI